ncbi:hypothetical protein SH467x_000591 [Pirellulaceae bacterium SH467]
MNHPVHPEAVADLQELLALCSLKFDRLASQEMDTLGFVSCCEELESLLLNASRLKAFPDDITLAFRRAYGYSEKPGSFSVNLNFRFGVVESLVGYSRWKHSLIDEENYFSGKLWILTAGTIAETSIGKRFEAICESSEGAGFDEDAEDLRAWPEVCRRYALAAMLLGRCLLGSPSRGPDPLFLTRAGKLLENQDSAKADAVDLKSDTAKSCNHLPEHAPDKDAGDDSSRDSSLKGMDYFREHMEKDASQVCVLYFVGVRGMLIGKAIDAMLEHYPNSKYRIWRSPHSGTPWNHAFGTKFTETCKNNGVLVKIGGKRWAACDSLLPTLMEIAKSKGW